MEDEVAGVVGFGLGPRGKKALDGFAHWRFVITDAVGFHQFTKNVGGRQRHVFGKIAATRRLASE